LLIYTTIEIATIKKTHHIELKFVKWIDHTGEYENKLYFKEKY